MHNFDVDLVVMTLHFMPSCFSGDRDKEFLDHQIVMAEKNKV
jgi:hypothetical protein